jgi:Cu(I)/Ag(I) efflux system membrane fusion protein
MNRTNIAGIAIAAVLVAAVAGYLIGPRGGFTPAIQPANIIDAQEAERTARAVLYWKDPDGKNDFSSAPKKTADGRDYLPVYEDQERDFAEARPAAPTGKGKILFYRNPMGLADTSNVPKKDWMGMDYIPVYEGEADASTVKINLDRVQRSGVRTEAARMQNLARPVRSAGIAKPDERTLLSVTLRADGFIEKLYVNETGKHVNAGEPMFSV